VFRRTSVAGYCLVLGVGSGALIEGLLGHPDLKIIGVDPDAGRINDLRDRFVEKGVYGKRVELFIGDPLRFAFPPYLASLIVSETPERLVRSEEFSVERLFGTLRPYGGVVCLRLPADDRGAFEQRVAAAGLPTSQLEQDGEFILLRKPEAPPHSAPWTHECADAARTFFSRDQRVKPPLGVLWYGDGPDHGFWKRKDYGVGVKPQVVGGRLFALRIASNTLVAYDVYTGRLLWTTNVDPFTRYASMEDGVYVAGGDRLTVHDPATGKPRAEFRYETEPGATPFVSDIRVSKDLIVIAAAPQKVRVIEEGLWDSTMLVALDRASGKTLWRRKAEHRFNNNALAVGQGKVFAIDSVSAASSGQAQRRGDPDESLPSTILALDARTGETVWSAVTENSHRTYQRGNWLGLRGNDDWLAYSESSDLVLAGKLRQAHAFEAQTGKETWSEPIAGAPWILCGETFINQGGQVYDVRSGKPAEKRFAFTRGGCNYVVANDHLLMLRGRSASSVDTVSGKQQSLFAIRSGCSNSLVAADGVLSVPNFAVGCVCNYPIQTSFAMIHMPEAAQWTDDTPAKPRLTGEMLRAVPEGAN
ncbi:MAG: PQQ-binding-like beta-propeller repeat protein, partial [Planctomycetota bacterium]